MINFCDKCLTIKPRDQFEDYYEYEENICIKCAIEGGPSEEELDAGDQFVHTMDQMMFGEEEEDFLPEQEDEVEEDEDFVFDGEIDEEENED